MQREAQATGNGVASERKRSLASVLQATPPERLDKSRRRMADLDRAGLLNKFSHAFASTKPLAPLATLILGDELTARGIPPCMRHLHLPSTELDLDQKFALLLADLRWLRRWYPDHAKVVRYRRIRLLLTGTETAFHREAEYLFWAGRRPAWKMVGSLSLDAHQQMDCAYLHSAPVKKRKADTQTIRERVFTALDDDMQAVRRTATFGDEEAQAALMRRFHLWLCWRMTDGSPTETAMRYRQMTGQEISRQAAAKQLHKVGETLAQKGITANKKKRARIT